MEVGMTDFAMARVKLEARLRDLTTRAQHIDDDLSQLGDDDWQESAIESEDDEVLEEIGEAALAEIRQIKFALSRIDAGSHGLCTSCGRSIAKQRLAALPDATKCVKCSRRK
jgi:RNA polymerase-binding transcription factor DksA